MKSYSNDHLILERPPHKIGSMITPRADVHACDARRFLLWRPRLCTEIGLLTCSNTRRKPLPKASSISFAAPQRWASHWQPGAISVKGCLNEVCAFFPCLGQAKHDPSPAL